MTNRAAVCHSKTPSRFAPEKGFFPSGRAQKRRRQQLVKAARLLHGEWKPKSPSAQGNSAVSTPNGKARNPSETPLRRLEESFEFEEENVSPAKESVEPSDSKTITPSIVGLADALSHAANFDDLVALFDYYPKLRNAAKKHLKDENTAAARTEENKLLKAVDSAELLYGDGLSTSTEPTTKEQYKRSWRIIKRRGEPILRYDLLIAWINSEEVVSGLYSFSVLIQK